MKSKILTLILLAIVISIVISIGYQVKLSNNGLEIMDIKIATYSGDNTRLSYLGYGDEGSVFTALKGYLLSWYTQQPSEVQDQYQGDGSYGYVAIYGDLMSAEAFKVGINGSLTKLSIYMSRAGSPPDLVVEIRGANADGTPDSTVYTSETIPASSIPTTNEWVDITLSNPIQVSQGETYTIVLSTSGGDTNNEYRWRVAGSDVYPYGCRVSSFDGGSSWLAYTTRDFAFATYISNGQSISSFQVSFSYSISSKYTVAYESDIGRMLNTFNYTINIYHNVDSNQTWILAYSTSYTNVTSFTDNSYVSPWISMLSGSYTQDYHDYYWKIEVIVDAYDAVTGSTLSRSSYVVLTDQFYWQSYADFKGLAELVDTNMNVETVIQPYSIILGIIIVLTYFIINKRRMELD